MTKPLPNWAIWLHMPTLTTHQAICLSFGLDPSKVHAYDSRFFSSVLGFNDCRTLFRACHPRGLSALQLSKWAQSVGWNIPIELARLAPVPVDAPETLPAEKVRAALLAIIADAANIDELHKELARAGITFTMRDEVETVEIPDGTVKGRREPLSRLYSALSGMDRRVGDKLDSYIKGSGASGSGARQSSFVSQQVATQTAPQQTTATPAPVGAAKQVGSDVKPWLTHDLRDPTPVQGWYTPARYFARQLAMEKPTLLSNRELLADKVSTALFNAGFKKRGGKLRFDSGTVLKALANVTYG